MMRMLREDANSNRRGKHNGTSKGEHNRTSRGDCNKTSKGEGNKISTGVCNIRDATNRAGDLVSHRQV